MQHSLDATFVPLRHAAAVLGVPLSWLRREACEGRVPAVRTGRQWLIHLERARETLTRRAETAETKGGAK